MQTDPKITNELQNVNADSGLRTSENPVQPFIGLANVVHGRGGGLDDGY